MISLEKAQNLAELVGLGMTVTFLVLAVHVCVRWRAAAVKSVAEYGSRRTIYGFLIVGVFISFVSEVLDSGYWLIPWSASYLGSPHTAFLVEMGAFANIPSRLSLGIIAALCHLFATRDQKEKRAAVRSLIFGAIAGVIFSAILYLVKHGR